MVFETRIRTAIESFFYRLGGLRWDVRRGALPWSYGKNVFCGVHKLVCCVSSCFVGTCFHKLKYRL